MKHDDLIKKLENLETPEIELSGHKRALKMALLSSGRFRKRTIMDWTRMLAPVATAVILIAIVGLLVDTPGRVYLGGSQISKFSSYSELEDFVRTNTQNVIKRDSGSWALLGEGEGEPAGVPAATEDSGTGYSATNIQVAGVDEADIVKTDGDYIYLVSGNRTIIVRAYPPEQAQVLSEIELEGRVIAIFINGDRLVVFGEETSYYPYYDYDIPAVREEPGMRQSDIMPYVSPKVLIKVYDISDRQNPQLQRGISADGQYVSSRMIGDYAYIVVNEPVYEEDDGVKLPRIYSYTGSFTTMYA
jgi:uncharacterized secreted protein with C-terminal beta-propeller domain